ncbi:glucose 1-dehydrogenase [Streptomyces rapamycinicus]|uniref:3-alpha-hydroxysteroid dehydrogenase n=2 Tax=Streptomyces rapamycinicus TaxID=1226757 RepID=A0A3L8R395_STRRN|nr:glucose 1-dehydrogenase [Streptomyces rapamycinicus]MBB4781558.1 3alpha(or 20beta)-hydroxysteroid dehydrogenase [Streptomyces rapamycinicus]RLV73798.1 3-alpha-hydroxysteroid dehydrogenase [Streptomyces rapamycinicus NRRL 5491]UTO62153.1 glucose 1-dehydrogenase [Streptomyces rapamycinicus]UTP30105.1 glucose 1-dehydrogenase [Streptomyces rapamycinicus NRRL 5491]
MRFEGKVAIVTGGARGMGASHARGLAAEGARVAICDLLDDEGEALAAELPQARYCHLDVTGERRWQSVVRAVQDTLGPVDVLVNNAGIIHRGSVEEQSPEHFRQILDVNLVGAFLGMHTVLPGMRERGHGAVVNVSSATGMTGFAGSVGYVASKWGVRGMTKAAALDMAGTGVRVNSVHPGVIRTPMGEAASPDLFAHQPVPRIGEPEEVTRMVLFLASDDASYTTGGEFLIDGGQTIGHRAARRTPERPL